MTAALWFAGLLGLIVAAAISSSRGRASPNEVARRSAIAVAAAAYAGLIVAAVWTWGGSIAIRARGDRLAEGAAVQVTVRGVRVPFAHPLVIGHGPAADVRVPGDGADTIARGDAGAVRGTSILPVPAGGDPAFLVATLGCAPGHDSAPLAVGATVIAVECAGLKPVRGLAIQRAATGELAIAQVQPERMTLHAGDVLRLGTGDAVPGVTTWDVTAPRGATALLAIPADPTTCAGRASRQGCLVDVGAFALSALPIVPDADAVMDRAARSAFAIGVPPLLLLLVLAASPRRGRRSRVLGRALRLGVLGVSLVALVCWRLLWAYRIDVMRELATIGPRVTDNALAAGAIGAALAGNAALALDVLDGRSLARRAAAAVAAWAAWLVVAWLAIGITPGSDGRTAGVVALSLVGALAPLLAPLAAATRVQRLGADTALAAIAIAAVAGRALAPHMPLCKLALAYATVLAGHAALRTMLGRDVTLFRRARAAAALAAAAVCVASYDAGVAFAIVGTGLALATLVAGHDAAYDASQASRLGVLEREHARLIGVHAGAAIAIALTVATAALVADDHALICYGALAVLHASLVIAVLFALAALVARSHRRGWVPWLCAALAALALWGERDALVERATAGASVAARRVSAVVDPGYALLRDEHAFAATASAWREAAFAPDSNVDPWRGQGYFGARLRDPGVARSVDNDYLPVAIARELGVSGVLRSVLLLLVIAIGAGAIASARLAHASREHRARWLVTAVAASVVVYQPVAALGVFPLTGISWPGLGIDSPADLWLFVIGAIWCVMGGDTTHEDERVRRTPRLARARALAIAALALAGVAAVIVVARAGASALGRQAADDERIDTAIAYAASLACPWVERDGATLDELVPQTFTSEPRDAATSRFDRELRDAWQRDRAALVAALPACKSTGGWRAEQSGTACVATFRTGWPAFRLAVRDLHARCTVERSDEALAALRATHHVPRGPRIRVVSAPLGIAADDAGELVIGQRVVRFRAGAPAVDLAGLADGLHVAGTLRVAPEVTLELRPARAGVMLRGTAELFVADASATTTNAAWRRLDYAGSLALDRVTLLVAGPPEHRLVALFRPPRAWGAATTIDSLLADDTVRAGDARVRRMYPYASALPELGWVNPYDRAHSVGLDGWIHAALGGTKKPAAAACGTLAPPPVARDRVCTTNPLDGVTECRVALQPELALSLAELAQQVLAKPEPHTGRDVQPVRLAYVVLRGDTGELLAQASLVAGRGPLVYAPADAAAEAELVRLREEPGESDAERVEWNLPIAVGSTLKPVMARAAELAFPKQIAQLALSADGHATGCKNGDITPLLGHCPPTPVTGAPPQADFHDFLARSPNWYQAALGFVGLGLPGGKFAVKGQSVTLEQIVRSDLASWPADSPLEISDASGAAIVTPKSVVLDRARQTPLWTRAEALLGRPLCTLGDRTRCERAAARADVCAARALPIAATTADLRYLVALGPDRIDLYASDRGNQTAVPVREYFQLLRGSGVHAIGSLAQITDAFGRVIYDRSDAPQLAASWFPAPSVGTVPAWSCATGGERTTTVTGAGGGLCAVIQEGGTAQKALAELLHDPHVVIYGAKTGTIDSLADIAKKPAACRAWNENHEHDAQLTCGKTPYDDSLFVIAFGVVTAHGTVPITLGVQLQRGGKGSATRLAPELVRVIERYLGG
jgi:hypothetical protein